MKIRRKWLSVYREAYSSKIISQASIEDYKYLLPEELALEVLEYLTHPNYLYLQFLSNTEDSYTGESIPSILCSDGLYSWDGSIIHWIEKYRIQLPQEFLDYVKYMKEHKPKGYKFKNACKKKPTALFLEKPRSYFN